MTEPGKGAPRYNYFQALWMSFYSKPFYREVARVRSGWALGFLLFLIAVCLAPRMFFWQRTVSNLVDVFEREHLPGIPEVRIRDGKASVDAKQPYALFPQLHEKPDDPVFILDTTGQTKDLPGSGFLLKETEAILVTKKERRVYPLASAGHWEITREKTRRWAEVGRTLTVPLCYVGGVLALFGYKILAVMVWALAALGVARGFKVPLVYEEGIRLAVFAQAPVYLLSLGVYLLGSRAAQSFALFWMVALFFLVYAVSCLKPDEPLGETAP